MNRFTTGIASITLFLLCASSVMAEQTATNNPLVVLHTNKGAISLELYPEQAPLTVANFLQYAETGFYEGTIFHRVIHRFMIQAGGFTKDMQQKATNPPVKNESDNGLHNERWTIAMARTNDPHSASSQFFINTKMNTYLDAGRGQLGYTVFGKVIDGQYVVKSIEKAPTHQLGGYSDVPVEAIVIERVEVK